MLPYIVRRGGGFRAVVHRETKRPMGTVGQHSGYERDRLWSSWSPFFDEAIGDLSNTMHEAAMNLFNPLCTKPVFNAKICKVCRNISPRPTVCATGECETYWQAELRSRRESREMWDHHDWVCALPDSGTVPDYVDFGDVARGRCSMQCQYASRYLAGAHGYADLGSDIRWYGALADYHRLRIHKDDVEAFVERVLKHRSALG
jgi:hypothetical protein